MAYCYLCEQDPREDGELSCTQIDGVGSVWACQDCLGIQPRRYPEGRRVPTIGVGMAERDIRVCSSCRTALRRNEEYTMLRIYPDEIEQAGCAAGQLHCCKICTAHLKEVVKARLVKLAIVAASIDAQSLSDGLLF